MERMTEAQIQQLCERRLAWCAEWQTPDLWKTLNARGQRLVLHAQANALAYHAALLHARRTRTDL